ncbi:hypothetical protein [Sulfurimonas sp.]|uniref:hypothetical protein n=1 Tax=Sulfurimonas sp. TaxID=2022749 RepID=UPI00356818AA
MNKYNYGTRSKEVLATCHPDIRMVFNEAIKVIDISCYEGMRLLKTQQKYFAEGKSKLDGIIKKSNHQGKEVEPEIYEDDKDLGTYSYNQAGEPIISFAVDAAPYPISFSNAAKKRARFYYMAGIIVAIGDKLYEEKKISHKIRWGGDWDFDNNFEDQSFDDLPHFELYRP